MNNLNEAIRWSRLARFGKSNLARLTIVAPFLGFLVFLNTGLENYISLGPVELSEGLLKYLADRRVEILYIGLSLLGAATGIFSLLAPDTIKSSEQYSDFIQFKESTKTDNAVIGSLEETIEACETRRIEFVESFHDIPETWNFPAKIKSSIYRLIIEVFEKSDDWINHSPIEQSKKEDDNGSSFYMFNGLPDIDPIFDCVANQRRVELAIWKSFFATSPDFSIDVFRLEYLIKDYSNPRLRCFVFALLTVGSAISLLPTMVSVWLVFQYSF